MKTWILAAATLLLVNGADARERRGPPSACPQPKVDCCEKPKCEPKKCEPAKCQPKPCKPACKPVCNPDPCCPPVCFEKGFPTDPCCTPSAYSEPADIDTRCGWDTFITANFIYWDVQQDGMILAVPYVGTVSGNVQSGTTAPSPVGAQLLKQDTDYTPGFQVGLGWAGPKDNWVMYAEYTWLHGSTTTSAVAPAPGITTLNGLAVPQNGLWLTYPWHNGQDGNVFATSVSSTWKYKIDLIDAQISRPFYSGTRFILEPFFGLRGSLIRQQLNITTNNLNSGTGVNGPEIVTHHSFRSIGIGPRAGFNGDWHFGYGLRFIGNTAINLLYTSFDARRNAPPGGIGRLPEIVTLDDYNALRPNLDMSLGLGWGSYFNCRRFHFDVAATYDFSIFWGQNMMNYLANEIRAIGSPVGGDLFLQGLTIQTRFDF